MRKSWRPRSGRYVNTKFCSQRLLRAFRPQPIRPGPLWRVHLILTVSKSGGTMSFSMRLMKAWTMRWWVGNRNQHWRVCYERWRRTRARLPSSIVPIFHHSRPCAAIWPANVTTLSADCLFSICHLHALHHMHHHDSYLPDCSGTGIPYVCTISMAAEVSGISSYHSN